MNTTTQQPGAQSTLASSAAFERFAIVFALATPVIYVICELANWPLFTYHPATVRVDLFYAPAVKGEGPAMYWYGWTASTFVGAGALGLLAIALPQAVIRKIPLSLLWILPLCAIPILVYALRSFWRW